MTIPNHLHLSDNAEQMKRWKQTMEEEEEGTDCHWWWRKPSMRSTKPLPPFFGPQKFLFFLFLQNLLELILFSFQKWKMKNEKWWTNKNRNIGRFFHKYQNLELMPKSGSRTFCPGTRKGLAVRGCAVWGSYGAGSQCMGVAVYGNCNMWELQWTSCSEKKIVKVSSVRDTFWGSCSVHELRWGGVVVCDVWWSQQIRWHGPTDQPTKWPTNQPTNPLTFRHSVL